MYTFVVLSCWSSFHMFIDLVLQKIKKLEKRLKSAHDLVQGEQ